LQAA
jgi:hypothetical protein